MRRSGVPVRDQVFIGYNRKADQAFVRELANWLRTADFKVWLDEEQIRPSANFELEITDALRESKHAVFVVSEAWLAGELSFLTP